LIKKERKRKDESEREEEFTFKYFISVFLILKFNKSKLEI